MPLSTDPLAIKAYQSAFAAARKVAARVDVMRWQMQYYSFKYRSAVRHRFAVEVEAAKIGFAEGFESAQNSKALRYVGGMRGAVRLSS